jgi:hypothetical protein
VPPAVLPVLAAVLQELQKLQVQVQVLSVILVLQELQVQVQVISVILVL